MISEDEATAAAMTLSVIPYFPAEAPARAVIIGMLRQMCDRPERLEWLVQRVINLWSQWEGPRELRAVYCSKFKPADGQEAISRIYPEGIVPSEKPLPAFQSPALPAGSTVSSDKWLDAGVIEGAAKKSLPPRQLTPAERKVAHRFDQVLRDVETAPADRAPAPLEKDQPVPEVYISALDVERAVAAKPDRKDEMIRQARETIANPRATSGQKQMAYEILRGFGEVA